MGSTTEWYYDSWVVRLIHAHVHEEVFGSFTIFLSALKMM